MAYNPPPMMTAHQANSPLHYSGEFGDYAEHYAAAARHASPFSHTQQPPVAPVEYTPPQHNLLTNEVNAVLDHAERVNTVAEKYRQEADLARAEAEYVRNQLEIERRSRPSTPVGPSPYEYDQAVEAEASRRAFEMAHQYAQISEDALRMVQREREEKRNDQWRRKYTPPPASVTAGRHTPPPPPPLLLAQNPQQQQPPPLPTTTSPVGRTTPPPGPAVPPPMGITQMGYGASLSPHHHHPPPPPMGFVGGGPPPPPPHVFEEMHKKLSILEAELKDEREKRVAAQTEKTTLEAQLAAERQKWKVEDERLREELDFRSREPLYWQMRSAEERRQADMEFAQMRDKVSTLTQEKSELKNQLVDLRNQFARTEVDLKNKEMELEALERDNHQLAEENRKLVDNTQAKILSLQQDKDRSIHSQTRQHMVEISEAQSTSDTYRMEADRLRMELMRERDARRQAEIGLQDLKKSTEFRNREFEADVTKRAEELVNTYKLIVENYEAQLTALRKQSAESGMGILRPLEGHSPTAHTTTETLHHIRATVPLP
eukprot:TRINITY_DN56115_c0_g1_i1.p1 TRINITY_DN56115_c0_g1~~TRINITY_DN56115_c0_g1_i1.p1  ORF type:complete len:545 (-),score=80.29 TRINITY_DN56115_c0_g1_i1:1148-2782(-)